MHTHTHTHTHMYICMYYVHIMHVAKCRRIATQCVLPERERERESEGRGERGEEVRPKESDMSARAKARA